MTVETNGQLAWTFEVLDFEGALNDLNIKIRGLQDFLDVQYSDPKTKGAWYIYVTEKKVDKYNKVALYLERLKGGQRYA